MLLSLVTLEAFAKERFGIWVLGMGVCLDGFLFHYLLHRSLLFGCFLYGFGLGPIHNFHLLL